MTGQSDITSRLREVGVIAILRRMPPDQVMRIAEALIAGGVQAIEVTADSPDALDAIRQLRSNLGESVLVGAGTVMTAAQLRGAREAGAQFFLSPHLDVSLVTEAASYGGVFMPGVLTPSEIVQAETAGARLLKLFPAGATGVSYLKDLLGPFHGSEFFPTGGVTPENAAAFIRAGAVGVGMGSALVPRESVERHAWAEITQRARAMMLVMCDAQQAQNQLRRS